MQYIPIVSQADQDFANWLNLIDATIGYDRRRKISLVEWNHLFQLGYSGFDAVQMCFSPDELIGSCQH